MCLILSEYNIVCNVFIAVILFGMMLLEINVY